MFLILMSLLSSAEAKSPYMWGVGPTVNTIVMPSAYPWVMPGVADDEDGNTLLEKTRGDMGIGAHGVLYMKKKMRVGSHVWYAFGTGGYRSMNWTVEYDFAGTESNGVSVLGGFGGGFGTQRWQTNDVGELSMGTYIIKTQGAVTYRTRRQAYEVGGYVSLILPATAKFNPSGEAGEEEVSGLGLYPHAGIEATVYFGDFKPPSSKKKKKR